MNAQTLGLLILTTVAFMDVIAIVFLFLEGRHLANMNEMAADDIAIFLQGRRAEEILKEMRDELRRPA